MLALGDREIMNVVIFFVTLMFGYVYCTKGEKRLLNDLLKGYQVNERPIAIESNPVVLNFNIKIQVSKLLKITLLKVS